MHAQPWLRACSSLVLAAWALSANAEVPPPPASLHLATWNLEWLIAPAAFKTLKTPCTAKGAPPEAGRLPCDVVQKLERSTRDFAVLARYARELDADVIALQEVDGAQAARLVFPGYEFCFTGRSHVQNTGFAIRAGLPHRCGHDVESLSLGDSVRRGAELVLFPGGAREVWLLGVHLKSGCSHQPLNDSDRACRELGRQAPALAAWINAQVRAGHRFAVLGDFNRELVSEQRAAATTSPKIALWSRLERDAAAARLVNAAERAVFRNCVPGQGYAAYIDHILLSRELAAALVPGSFHRVTYTAVDARRTRLSDHCPVAIRLGIEQIAPR